MHRFAGWLWRAAGLLVIAGAMAMATSTIMTAALVLIALAAPVVYGQSMRKHLNWTPYQATIPTGRRLCP